jgi:hypothetical protein
VAMLLLVLEQLTAALLLPLPQYHQAQWQPW